VKLADRLIIFGAMSQRQIPLVTFVDIHAVLRKIPPMYDLVARGGVVGRVSCALDTLGPT
jgi:hypothetical protein